MAVLQPGTFDSDGLYAAIDEERTAPGMTWADVSKDLRVSVSTVRGLRTGGAIETDGVLQMTPWLGRSVESLHPGGCDGDETEPAERLGTGRFLRFDTPALHVALDQRRRERGMTWVELARDVSPVSPVGASMLTRLEQGGRIEVHRMLALVGSLGERVDTFTRLTAG